MPVELRKTIGKYDNSGILLCFHSRLTSIFERSCLRLMSTEVGSRRTCDSAHEA